MAILPSRIPAMGLCAGILMLGAGIAAQPAHAASDKAAVIEKGACGAFVPTESGGVGPALSTADGKQKVHTSSGVTNLRCHFDVPEALRPASVVSARGFLCGTGYGNTTDSMMMVNPRGQGLLMCTVRRRATSDAADAMSVRDARAARLALARTKGAPRATD